MPETCPHVVVITCLSPAGHDGPHYASNPLDAADYLGGYRAQVRREVLKEAARAVEEREWPPGFDFTARMLVAKWLRTLAKEPPR